MRNPAPLPAIVWIALALLVGAPVFAQTAGEEPVADAPGALAEPPADAAIEPIVEMPPVPSPPTAVTVESQGVGAECRARIAWQPATDVPAGAEPVYEVYRRTGDEGEFMPIGEALGGKSELTDTSCGFDQPTIYRVTSKIDEQTGAGVESEPIVFVKPLVDRTRANVFILGLIISVSIIYFISHVKAGKKLFIRKIAGLEAVDEAIGRATEMGRPILFIPGIMDMNDVQTVSSVIILGRIAKTIAEYDTKLFVPTSKSLVMTTARETVKEAYLSAGRPDAYNDDMITYLTDEQFGYVAGVNGIMAREKPATCFYLGAFFAESLILAETGNSIGAIQVAGTAMPSQLPFFIAACDYTLIGEELFAASAYLSHEAKQLGSLKGQDVGKAIAMFAIVIGTVLETVAAFTAQDSFIAKAASLFTGLFAS